MKISGRVTSCCWRRCSTCRAMMSRKDSPSRTGSSDLARSIPIDVPSPPLSLMTTVWRSPRRRPRRHLDVLEGLHVRAARSSTRGSSRSRRARAAGSSGLNVVDRDLGRPRPRDHLVACRAAHRYPWRRSYDAGPWSLTAEKSAAPRRDLSRRGSPARARPAAHHRRPPVPTEMGDGRAAGHREHSSPTRRYAGRTVDVVRLGARRARHGGAHRRAARAGIRVLLPVTAARPRPRLGHDAAATRARRGCSSLGPGCRRVADLVLAPGLAVDRTGIADGPGRRLLRPGAAARRAGTPVVVLLHPEELLDAGRAAAARGGARPAGRRGRHRRRPTGSSTSAQPVAAPSGRVRVSTSGSVRARRPR